MKFDDQYLLIPYTINEILSINVALYNDINNQQLTIDEYKLSNQYTIDINNSKLYFYVSDLLTADIKTNVIIYAQNRVNLQLSNSCNNSSLTAELSKLKESGVITDFAFSNTTVNIDSTVSVSACVLALDYDNKDTFNSTIKDVLLDVLGAGISAIADLKDTEPVTYVSKDSQGLDYIVSWSKAITSNIQIIITKTPINTFLVVDEVELQEKIKANYNKYYKLGRGLYSNELLNEIEGFKVLSLSFKDADLKVTDNYYEPTTTGLLYTKLKISFTVES